MTPTGTKHCSTGSVSAFSQDTVSENLGSRRSHVEANLKTFTLFPQTGAGRILFFDYQLHHMDHTHLLSSPEMAKFVLSPWRIENSKLNSSPKKTGSGTKRHRDPSIVQSV
jgi:hypothetical protein